MASRKKLKFIATIGEIILSRSSFFASICNLFKLFAIIDRLVGSSNSETRSRAIKVSSRQTYETRGRKFGLLYDMQFVMVTEKQHHLQLSRRNWWIWVTKTHCQACEQSWPETNGEPVKLVVVVVVVLRFNLWPLCKDHSYRTLCIGEQVLWYFL